MKFFLLAIFIGLFIWGLCLAPVRQAIGLVPAKVWLAAVIALLVATTLFAYAYSGGGIRLF